MNNHEQIQRESEDGDDNDHRLNPPPRKYRVSFFTKCAFLIFFAFGMGAYLYLIIDRKISQNQFVKHNQMAAIKLSSIKAPDITVVDATTGKDLPLRSAFGSWTLLNIWATWCPPCREEMPSLEALHQKFSDKLTIAALSVDDNLEAVKDFIAVNKPNFKVLWDQEQVSAQRFGIDKYPESFLISPDGYLVYQFSGPRDWASATAIDYFLSLLY